MKTYTVPVFLGVQAESEEDARRLATSCLEDALDYIGDPETFLYCDIGLDVVEQEEVTK